MLIILLLIGYKPRDSDELDPMDPASYSDIPRCVLTETILLVHE